MQTGPEENRGLILVIDDDLDFGCLLRLALVEAGVSHRMEFIGDGSSAIDYFIRASGKGSSAGAGAASAWSALNDLALVLLDLKMPRLGGLEVLNWMRSQREFREVPVVVFTGLEDAGQWSEAQQAGATAVRMKPFSFRELVREAEDLRCLYLSPTSLKYAA